MSTGSDGTSAVAAGNSPPSALRVSIVAGLILLALLFRVAVLAVDGERLQSDPDGYVRLARMLAAGNGYVATDGARPTAFRPILYPLLLAVPLSVGCSPAVAVGFWNLVSGVLLVAATIGLARLSGIRRTGIFAAGVIAACNPLLLRYASEPMTENVSAALTAMSLFFAGQYLATLRTAGRPAVGRAIPLGVLLGLGALCRPVTLVTCAFLTAAFLMAALGSHSGDGRMTRRKTFGQSLLVAVLPALIAAVTVSPWIFRNAIHFGQLIPATTHGGYTLLLGNNPVFFERVVSGKQTVWDGDSLRRWQRQLHDDMQADGINPADEVASDAWMYRRAFRVIREQPGTALQAAVLRWRRFWALRPSATTENLPGLLTGGTAVWCVLIGVGLLGSLAELRRPGTLLRVLWLVVLSFLLVHTFYWTNTRMRAPLTGVLAVLSAAGWSFWIAGVKLQLAVSRGGPKNGSVAVGQEACDNAQH